MKAPHLKAARDIDEVWMPPVKTADKWAKYLRTLMEAYQTRKLRAQREAEAARLAALSKIKDAIPVAPVVMPDQIRSGHGRAASVRPKVVVVEVTNVMAACQALQDEPELVNLIAKLAQKRLDETGEVIPGVVTEERAVVR